MRRMQKNRDRRGFTLTEMVLVIVIIGILAGSVVVGLVGRSKQAHITRANADLQGALGLALDLFEQDMGRYPTAAEGLAALTTNLGGNWGGPYLKGGLKPDPWGNAYAYQRDPDDENHYVVKSAGPDGAFGSDDDIVHGSK